MASTFGRGPSKLGAISCGGNIMGLLESLKNKVLFDKNYQGLDNNCPIATNKKKQQLMKQPVNFPRRRSKGHEPGGLPLPIAAILNFFAGISIWKSYPTTDVETFMSMKPGSLGCSASVSPFA
jgi:hypothetical protein